MLETKQKQTKKYKLEKSVNIKIFVNQCDSVEKKKTEIIFSYWKWCNEYLYRCEQFIFGS